MPSSTFLRVSFLSLAFHAFRIQATPLPTTDLTKAVSILDLLGENPEILQVGNFSYQHSLPEPDWNDSYIENGIQFYRYPEGTILPDGFWDERSSVEIPQGNAAREPGGAPANSCPGLCSCSVQTVYSWITQNWNTVSGDTHLFSDPVCSPGNIGHSYSYTYSYSLSIQAGPDLKFPTSALKNLDKFGIRAGFSYTWGTAQGTTYSVGYSDPNQRHPFVETFRPNIFVVNGMAQIIRKTLAGFICSVSAESYLNLHLPLVEGDNNDCQGSDKICGAAGVYDSCFYLGDYARLLCPRRNLGPTPSDRACPSFLYPSPYN
ncbi:hypothetical protein BDZ45DRAFT_682151 [Acephala macrosclerotiorum]|nr:hypothetical protein BDZ45DRAFT_682151 [Acephala macrosclerotiorum]